jgi:hypothetical protein
MARIAASDNSHKFVVQDCKIATYVMNIIRSSADSYEIDPGHIIGKFEEINQLISEIKSFEN